MKNVIFKEFINKRTKKSIYFFNGKRIENLTGFYFKMYLFTFSDFQGFCEKYTRKTANEEKKIIDTFFVSEIDEHDIFALNDCIKKYHIYDNCVPGLVSFDNRKTTLKYINF